MKRLMPLFGLLVLVGAAGFIVYSADQDPTGQATGQSSAKALWADLSAYENLNALVPAIAFLVATTTYATTVLLYSTTTILF